MQYGVSERQMRGYFKKALRASGDSGVKFFEFLERRFDNVIYRFQLASTRAAARQLVSHGFFRIHGRRMDIPSYSVKPGDVISLAPQKVQSKIWQKPVVANGEIPAWLSWDADAKTGAVLAFPGEAVIPKNVNMKYIIEYYSR